MRLIFVKMFTMKFDRGLPPAQDTVDMEKQVKFIPKGCLAVTSSADPKPMVGTTSLTSCAGLAVYDPDAKVGGGLHAFFKEKEVLTDYMRDERGREIPGTEGLILINNPFGPFSSLTRGLVDKAISVGGDRFDLYAFNIDFGIRTPNRNRQLRKIAEELLQELEQAGRIRTVSWRNERNFKLDTRTGVIVPYYHFKVAS